MNTLFLLMAQFNTAAVTVEQCAGFFGLSPREAMNQAAVNKLPVPTFRMRDSQKSPPMVHLSDLATHIDHKREAANQAWHRANSL